MNQNQTTTTTSPKNAPTPPALPEAFPEALAEAIIRTASATVESAVPAGAEGRPGRRSLKGGADVGGLPADAPVRLMRHALTGRRDLAHVHALANKAGSKCEAFPWAGGFLVVAVGAKPKNGAAPVEYGFLA